MKKPTPIGGRPPEAQFLCGRIALRLVVAAVTAVLTWPIGTHAEIVPPGFKPPSPGVHAIVGAKVIIKPGEVLEKANILIREGKIESVGTNTPPAEARIWDGAGTWVYPAFVEANWQVDGSGPSHDGEDEESKLTSGNRFYGVNGAEKAASPSASWQNSPGVNAHHRMALDYKGGSKLVEPLRKLGFAAAVAAPSKGIFRGSSTLVLLNNDLPSKSTLRGDLFQNLAWHPLTGKDKGYPRSLMGVISLTRQTFLDAEFQSRARTESQLDPALAALKDCAAGRQPVLIEPGSVLMLDRAAKIASELHLNFFMIASGQEWRRPELIAASKARLILPLDFPEIPKLPEEPDWESVTLDQLRAWDWAPENPALLKKNGVLFALSTTQMADKKEFRKHLKQAVDRGLSQDDALAALTTIPAGFIRESSRLGTIEAGKFANLLVVAGGSYFEPTNEIREVWVAGEVFRQQIEPPKPPKKDASKADKKSDEKPKHDDSKRIAHSPAESRGPSASPKLLLVRNAVLWTSSTQGILTNSDLLVENGKIKSIGSNLSAPDGAMVIDAKGKHITPGIIDCHNHSFVVGAVNEATLPSSAMVRIEDVINSETRNLANELAGGLTTANVLHGSANPIGGQNCVVKLRDGAAPDEMKFAGAPSGIKFALGENVKQSNWGDNEVNRFPQTRMGVRTFFDNRFSAAREYQQKRRQDPAGTRRDLELDALVEILEGARLIHCHSYRQDEILMLIRLMESYNVRIGTFQHILEGYKVAEEIARHGAGASAFSDWWAYKYEVMDAIPYAGSLMRERGVTVSFNSDSSDLARRLNFEAAKAVKYGGTSEEEALKFVTINPARQLGIDKQVGSLEVGKDADFAIWSGNPLDTSSRCLETWIDGARYFERELALQRAAKLQAERAALLKKAKDAAGDGGGEAGSEKGASFFRIALEMLHEGQERHCEDLD